MKFIFRMSLMALAAMVLISSCTKEDNNLLEIENFTNNTLDGIERACKTGKHGCFEFVWPVSLLFADGTTSEFADQDALREGIRTWKEANPDAETRPQLVFPLDILDEEGNLFNITSQEELREVVQSCRDSFGRRGHARRSCIRLNFPVNISFPDATEATYDDRMALKEALKSWKEANPDAETRPTLVFPVNVTVKSTEEEVSVGSSEELQALKTACREN